jgi:hypothetical protein
VPGASSARVTELERSVHARNLLLREKNFRLPIRALSFIARLRFHFLKVSNYQQFIASRAMLHFVIARA